MFGLRTLTIHWDIAANFPGPEAAATRILGPYFQASVQVPRSTGQRVVGRSLDGPLTHEDGEAIVNCVLCVLAEELGKVGRGGRAPGKVVVVHVEDNVVRIHEVG